MKQKAKKKKKLMPYTLRCDEDKVHLALRLGVDIPALLRRALDEELGRRTGCCVLCGAESPKKS